MTDINSGRVLEMHQDSSGNLLEEVQDGIRVGSEFSGTGKRTVLHYPGSGPQVDFERDTAGRLRQVRSQNRTLARFDYLGTNRIAGRTQSALGIAYRYSARSDRLDGIDISGLASPISYDLERDRMNRLRRSTRSVGGASDEKHWQYDSAGRVVQERRAGVLGASTTNRLFDGDGVLRREDRGTSAFDQQREERGRIVSRGGTRYQYDQNGNMTDDGNLSFEWDAWDRLTKVKRGLLPVAGYAYDALHRVIKKTTPLGSEDYIYDGWRLIEVRDGGIVTERFIYSDDVDDVVAIEKGNTTYIPVYGPEGHVDMLVDDQQNIVERYEYDLRGRVVVLDASGTRIPNAVPQCRFLFQRRWYDTDTGLYCFRRRWYHPETGTFLTPDPLGFQAGSDLYGLCHGDPVNYSDPFGMDDEEDSFWTLGKIVGIAAAVVVGTVVTVATAGLAGPAVGATAAAIIGGIAGGAAGGAVGAISEGLIDRGEVDWSEVGYSALIGGVLGGIFSGAGVGISAALTRTVTGQAITQGLSRIGGSLATSTAGRFISAAGRYAAVRGTARVLSAPVRGMGYVLRGIHTRSEALGTRIAASIEARGYAWFSTFREVPFLNDFHFNMAMKAWVARHSMGQEGMDLAANAAYQAARGAGNRFQSVVAVEELADDMLRVSRVIGTADDFSILATFSDEIPASQAPMLRTWSRYLREAGTPNNFGGHHSSWPDLFSWGRLFFNAPAAPIAAAANTGGDE